MVIADEKECWSTAKVIDETVLNLCSIRDKDGFRRYLKYAKWYVHRISIYNPPPSFDISRQDLSTKVKKELASYSNHKELFKEILIEIICRICELANKSDFNQIIDRRKIIPRFV